MILYTHTHTSNLENKKEKYRGYESMFSLGRLKKQRNHSSFCTDKGITLIALVITIIVLLILAGITIGNVTGENGIIKQANKAKEESQIVDEYEQLQEIVTVVLAKSRGGLEKGELEKALKSRFGEISLINDNGPWLYEGKYKNYYIYNDGDIKEKADYSGLGIGDYVNYNVNYENLNSYNSAYKVKDEYKGWRILSVDKDNNIVRVVSSGIPLTYDYVYNTVTKAKKELTDEFLKDTTKFVSYGFKDTNNNIITTTSEMRELFLNNFTEKENENPKVQSLINQDIENVTGKITWGKFAGEDLFSIPCNSNNEGEYGTYYLGTNYYGQQMWGVNLSGQVVNLNSGIKGIRPVVTLKTNIKFTKDDKESTDSRIVWNISL